MVQIKKRAKKEKDSNSIGTNEKINKVSTFQDIEDTVDYQEEETLGLSWQAISAIMMAIQKGMVETMRGNEFDSGQCIYDFQMVFRDAECGEAFEKDPGLYVINPPVFRALTKEEMETYAMQQTEDDEDEEVVEDEEAN